MKQRMQGIVMGVLVMTLLFGTMTVFAASTQTIEVTFGGVRTFLFGQEFVVRDEQGVVIEPLTYNDRVYVPVDSILHAMGNNASWDAATGILRFGQVDGPVVGTPTGGASFARTVPPFDVSHSAGDNFTSRGIRIRDNVTMGGNYYNDVITFTDSLGMSGHVHSLHNLEGRFTTLTGYIGRVDGTSQQDGVFRLIGDGRQIQEIEVRATDLPRLISVNVSGVRNFRIEFEATTWSGTVTYAFVGTIR